MMNTLPPVRLVAVAVFFAAAAIVTGATATAPEGTAAAVEDTVAANSLLAANAPAATPATFAQTFFNVSS